jgi:hypothetical protein
MEQMIADSSRDSNTTTHQATGAHDDTLGSRSADPLTAALDRTDKEAVACQAWGATGTYDFTRESERRWTI